MYVEVHSLLWEERRFLRLPIQGTCSNVCTLVLTRYILKPKLRKEHNLLGSKQGEEVEEPGPDDVGSLRLAV
jgi:hypothetical protein